MGQVISDAVRKAVAPKSAPGVCNGVPLFVAKVGARTPNLALVNQLRDED
jgi:hypothetical protein